MDFTVRNINAPFDLDDEIPLFGEAAKGADLWTTLNGESVIRNIVNPTLVPFRPPVQVPDRNEAVIIAPGGGMLLLAIENEGVNVAETLAAEGYTAYVLKYRVQPTTVDPEGFQQQCHAFYAQKMANGPGRAESHLESEQAVADLVAAVAHIRAPQQPQFSKLHFLGFSAGAKVGVDALALPAFDGVLSTMALLYFSLECPPSIGTQPPALFAAMANDDPLFSRSGFGLIEKWQEVGQEVEFHLFKNGGHGFAGKPNGSSSDQWFTLYLNWLKMNHTK